MSQTYVMTIDVSFLLSSVKTVRVSECGVSE